MHGCLKKSRAKLRTELLAAAEVAQLPTPVCTLSCWDKARLVGTDFNKLLFCDHDKMPDKISRSAVEGKPGERIEP